MKFFLASILEDPDLMQYMKAIEKKVEDFDHLHHENSTNIWWKGIK